MTEQRWNDFTRDWEEFMTWDRDDTLIDLEEVLWVCISPEPRKEIISKGQYDRTMMDVELLW